MMRVEGPKIYRMPFMDVQELHSRNTSSFPCRHVYSTRTFMIPVLVFTLLYNVPKFFELYTERVAVDEAGLPLENVTLAEANQGHYSIEFCLHSRISKKNPALA